MVCADYYVGVSGVCDLGTSVFVSVFVSVHDCFDGFDCSFYVVGGVFVFYGVWDHNVWVRVRIVMSMAVVMRAMMIVMRRLYLFILCMRVV